MIKNKRIIKKISKMTKNHIPYRKTNAIQQSDHEK